MKKWKKAIASTILGCLALAGVAQAATLGTLSYWYDSTSNNIYRWTYQPAFWSTEADTWFKDNGYNFTSWVTNSMTQWGSVRTSYGVDNSSDAQILVYGGTYNTLKNYFSPLSSSADGATVWSPSPVYEGEWNYNGSLKGGSYLRGAKVYIVGDKWFKTNSKYHNTVLHEFGHAIGWVGHSSSSSDVMYDTNTSITTLTTRDKNHLVGVYK
ncbi:matrixin family metalloprotease [Ammoniphilus sp. YIM 78166]|uniref:matrixin family metalloprotease n=1 Tax=Ammoniphilus sp. YIM 78166 TaxID=1644106 RepID=UPI00107068CE|nr:matrixin family metalloprotease [Ammoniphilus sp. YIM 78166]